MVLPCRLVIFDSEFTAWQGSAERNWSESWEHREVIQLSALRLVWADDGYVSEGIFDELVLPVKNPQLSPYITHLTGIEQTTLIQKGLPFEEVLNRFYAFSLSGQLPLLAWGKDNLVLKENCQINQCIMPNFQQGFIDLRKMMGQLEYSLSQLSSGQLAEHLGVTINGQAHDALHDVLSILSALNVWVKQQLIQVDTE
jgi:inhibitor of KinA sporulation pathway (predicted exonuclease)